MQEAQTQDEACAARPHRRWFSSWQPFAWAVVVLVGTGWLVQYASAPGPASEVPAAWPAGSAIALHPAKPTLVVLVHPKCPCSRASLGELAVLMADHGDRVDAHVLFIRPQSAPLGWEQTHLFRSAVSIPGVSVSIDTGGLEASRFAAQTSGEAALYGVEGQLLFVGGLTASRGHSGDNAGRDAISNILTDRLAERASTPVFGCPLEGRTDLDLGRNDRS